MRLASLVAPFLVAVCAVSAPLRGAEQGKTARARDPVGPPFQRLIERVAARHRLDPDLLAALVEVESGRDPEARSRKGALGLVQLMPQTARRFGARDPLDAEENLEAGARYLCYLLHRFRGDLRLALAAWNAGEGAVERFGGVPPYPETTTFLRRVLARLSGSRGEDPPAPPGRVRVEREPGRGIVVTNR